MPDAARRNAAWERDEIVLACDLVMRNDGHWLPAESPQVIELSELLQWMPLHPPEVRRADFRNPYAVARKTADIATALPGYSGRPTNGGRRDKEVISKFLAEPNVMHYVAESIRKSVVENVSAIGPGMLFSDAQPLPSGQEILGATLVDGRLRIISIQADGAGRFLDPCSQSHHFLYVASLEAHNWICLIDEFEALINSARVSESQLQDFFERNPDFLCGDMYEAVYPHIVLQRQEAGPLIPDFALKPHSENALCDLVELKRPSARLVVGQSNRKRLSSGLLEACAQLREYRDYFELPGNRKAIEEIYGLRFFRPRMVVVIGKRADYLAYDLRKAESDIPHLTITTYDDLLERARSRMRRA